MVPLNNLCLHPLMRTAFQYSVAIFLLLSAGWLSGCANIIPPTGGPRDSIPPMLLSSTPPDSSRNSRPTRIVLNFNEYVDQINSSENIIISPTINGVPDISSRLRSVTVRLKDTLEANTTYSINFGNSIKDVNEGNVLQNFTYVFSTGDTIDSLSLSGKVVLAETGKVDSTLLVLLHRNLNDSAVQTLRPRYYTRLDGEGRFTFRNLPAGQFNVFALSSQSFSRQYTDSTVMFAFLDKPVNVTSGTSPLTLHAYEEAKRKPINTSSTSGNNGGNKNQDRRLRYSNGEGGIKDVLTPMQLDFNRKLKGFDSSKFSLTDTNYRVIPGIRVQLDSSYTRITIRYPWQPDARYKLLIQKDAVSDADGVTLSKNDTINFMGKSAADYGSLRLRFMNIDLSRNPVLQIVQGDVVMESVVLTGRDWKRELFKPGEYNLRILYDANKNGSWDPGNYKQKKQPEIVVPVTKPLSVKANWENEVDINL